MSAAVTAALSTVHHASSGTAVFDTEAEADEFVEGVYDKFPPLGYGTTCVWRIQNGKYVAEWHIYCAD